MKEELDSCLCTSVSSFENLLAWISDMCSCQSCIYLGQKRVGKLVPYHLHICRKITSVYCNVVFITLAHSRTSGYEEDKAKDIKRSVCKE